MAKPVTGSLPNLVNGVSQQAFALRLATQGDMQENYYSTIVEGLKDRPPSMFVAKLLSSLPAGVFSHIINRDANERYVVIYDTISGQIRVWGFDGVQRTVNAPNGWGYLSGITDPVSQLRALTIEDYTFIVNTTKLTAMASAPVQPVRPFEALINVLAGNYGKTYSITINGALVASYATPIGDNANESPQLDTNNIAGQLAGQLAANGLGAGVWQLAQYSNMIYLVNTAFDYNISVSDGYNGHAMVVVKGQAQRFSDLPQFGPAGPVVQVMGDNTNVFDNYWVEFNGGTPGQWKETVAPGTPLTINALTMPFSLRREADGTFTFSPMTWDPRKCGDASLSPDPSFIGHTIQDVYFHRNRLGFLSGENCILSRNGSFFDFFRTSATAVLDDDPIDISASHVKVSTLRHAVPYQDNLLLFSDQTQFFLAGTDQLTPKTASIRPRTEYVSDPNVAPVGLGTSVFFTSTRGSWASMWEYTIDRFTQIALADEVTSHVPAFIPSGIFRVVGTTNESVLCALTAGDPSAMYVYRFYWSGQNKLQAAWQRWTFPGVTAILDAELIQSDLYVVVKRSDGVYLERMPVHPSSFDTGLGFTVHLDQRVHTSALAAPAFNSTTQQTTYTLPYAPSASIQAVTSTGGSALPALDVEVASVNPGAQTVTLKGDTRNYAMWFGYTYERRYRFSRIFLRQPSPGGGTTTVEAGRLQLKYLTLVYDKAANFRVEVTPEGRSKKTYNFTGRKLGSAQNVLGGVNISAGKMSIPIMSRNDRVTIELVNNSWMPSAFISAEWSGTHNEKAREL